MGDNAIKVEKNNIVEATEKFIAAYKERESSPQEYLTAGLDLVKLEVLTDLLPSEFQLMDLALVYVHAQLRNGLVTQHFIMRLAQEAFPGSDFSAVLDSLREYKTAAEKFLKSLYCPIYWNDKLSFDSQKALEHNQYSEGVVLVAYNIENILKINTTNLFNELKRAHTYSGLKDNIPFWISSVNIELPRNKEEVKPYLKSYLLNNDAELEYEMALRVWVTSMASRDYNHPLYRNDYELEDEYNELLRCTKKVSAPKPHTSLRGLVLQCVDLELGKDANKDHKYKMIIKFAQIKYGPTALMNAFVNEEQRIYKERWIDKGKDNKGNDTFKRAFTKAFLVIAGVALIAVSVATAVVTFGADSPLAFIGVVGGLGLIAAALGGTMYYRDHIRSLFNLKKDTMKVFIDNGNSEGKELSPHLPSYKPAKAN